MRRAGVGAPYGHGHTNIVGADDSVRPLQTLSDSTVRDAGPYAQILMLRTWTDRFVRLYGCGTTAPRQKPMEPTHIGSMVFHPKTSVYQTPQISRRNILQKKSG